MDDDVARVLQNPAVTAKRVALLTRKPETDPDAPTAAKKAKPTADKDVPAIRVLHQKAQARAEEAKNKEEVLTALLRAVHEKAAAAPKHLRGLAKAAAEAMAERALELFDDRRSPLPRKEATPTTLPPAQSRPASQDTNAGATKKWSQIAKSPAHQGKGSPIPPAAPSASASKQGPPKKPAKPAAHKNKKDDLHNVVLVQVPAEAQKQHPWALLKTLQANGAPAKEAWVTKLGYGIRFEEAAGQALGKHGELIRLKTGGSPTAAHKTHTVIVKRVPTVITDHLINPADVAEETYRVTGQTPMDVFKSKHNDDAWLIKFREPPPRAFKLYLTSAPSRPVERRKEIPQCRRCWRFHSTVNCRFGERCVTCGNGKEHSYPTVPHCPNCNSPHRADAPKCPLRPREGAPIGKEQRAAIRQAGTLAWKEATKAKAPPPAPTANKERWPPAEPEHIWQ